MTILATIIGFCAVLMFVLSYQLKSRSGIILFNAGSRILYVTQYILLGAFEGALLDIVAFGVSLLCAKSNSGDARYIKKYIFANQKVEKEIGRKHLTSITAEKLCASSRQATR